MDSIPLPDGQLPKGLLHDEILPRLERIKKICGPLCEIASKEALEAITLANNNTLIPQVQVPINCTAIMESEDIDAADSSVPFPIPKELEHLYSWSGAIHIRNWTERLVNVYLGKRRPRKWTSRFVGKTIRQIKDGVHFGTYGVNATAHVRDHLRNTGKIQGSRVLVIGSEKPRLEAICLLLGAKIVVTLEYGPILSTYPNLQTLTPSEFRVQYINGSLEEFDVVVSYSSVEHSGLGRYGDALNPWGDLLAVARAWCVTKPGGAIELGLPTGFAAIEFNAHRIYGKMRWPLMTANWIQVDSAWHTSQELEGDNWENQPLMVFEKMDELKSE